MVGSRSRDRFRRPRLALALVAVLLLGSLGACSGGDDEGTKAGPPGASASRTPSKAPARPVATLTGTPGPAGPVFAIKVDNAPSARPLQRGLDAAAVVYQEVVEGGATRYMAIFVGSSGTVVGPVRSARDTDLSILEQYGRVVFGFSGANAGVLAHVRAADLLDVPHDYVRSAYWIAGRRREAFNVYTTPARLLTAAQRADGGREAAQVRDVGLRFGAAPAGGAPVSAPVTLTFSHRSSVTIAYDAVSRTWRLRQSGVPVRLSNGAVVTPANVVVQRVDVHSGQYVDKTGYASPDTVTVGSGPVSVYRDGHRFDGTWSRPRASAPTRFVGADGKDIRLAPGRTWILLLPKTPITGGNPAARPAAG